MKKLSLLLLSVSLGFAEVHYSKLEPFTEVTLKAAASGLVTGIDLSKEGRYVTDKKIVQLDDATDRVQLRSLKISLAEAKKQLTINEEVLKNLEESAARQAGHYERVNALDTRPKNEKDSVFYSYVNAKNQYLSTKEKISSLKDKIASTRYSIAQLEDMIDKKSFEVTGYVDSISVRVGDYLNPGSPVAVLKDTSKAKLTVYLSPEELEHKRVLLDGKVHEKGFDKIWSVTDAKHISSYKAQIILTEPKQRFGKLIKVEVQ